MIKGRSDPMDVYIPAPARAITDNKRQQDQRILVGRSSEKQKILDLVNRWRARFEGLGSNEEYKSRNMVIAGESGLGKSALGDYFLDEVRKDSPNVLVCIARAREHEVIGT
jgi:Cdc6-like AAA superfamily ATPase